MKKVVFLLVAASLILACSVVAMSADAAKGKEVYAAQKCQLCHSIAGVGNKKNPLDGVGSKLKPEEVKKWIVSPKEMNPKTTMTAKPNLPAADLDNLVEYMMSLKK